MGGASNPPPPPPAIPAPPIPDYEGERQAEARAKLEDKLRKKLGSKQTILTSALGDSSAAPTAKSNLLGE
jgi:hypothetical protein